MRHIPTGTVTLLFTDIEGSTRLLQRVGECYATILEAYRSLLRAAFLEFDGYEVDTQGDAFFVAFARASDAVTAAVAAQRALADHPWPQGATVRVRMGLHTGEPSQTAEGYVGLDLHRAARIMSAGHGGQVLLSYTTRDLVEQTLPQGVSLLDLGAHRLKDLQQKSQLYQLVIAGLPADFPPLKTLDSSPNNLPLQPTPFIGREKEVNAVQLLLLGIEEVVAPGNGIAEGLLPHWQIAFPTRQYSQALPQPCEERLRWQQFDTRRRQLDSQWQPIQMGTDFCDG